MLGVILALVSSPAGTAVPREARDFGSYQLIAKLATGGMAEIFLARAPGTPGSDGLVVIKRILPHLADDEHFVTMFRDEAALASKLEHENVGRVQSLGNAQGTWFIVMEYLHGVALSKVLSRMAKARQLPDIRIAAGIVIQACEGLHHAHEARGPDGAPLGVVHRDVSPPNIFVTEEGVVKLLDFGIAKARGASSKTRTGTVKGKNAYMSPEQILGKPLDRRSDVFALGAVLYELLTVKRLFHRDSDFLTFKAITEEPIPDPRERRPDLPLALRSVVTRALARDVNGRFSTAQEMADAVRAAITPFGGPASSEEIARVVQADFGDELGAKRQLFDQAAAAPVDADSSVIPTLSPASSSGQIPAVAPTVVDKPMRRGNAPAEVRGEMQAPAQRRPGPPPIPGSTPAVVVQQGSGRTRPPTAPPPIPGAAALPLPAPADATPIPPGPPPPTTPAPALRAEPLPQMAVTVAPLTSEHTLTTDINTDLLGARRRGFAIKATVIVIVLAAVVAAIVMFGGGRADEPRAAATPDAGAAVAAPVDAAPPDAIDKADITAQAKFGYFSIDADAPTMIYIDGAEIGPTPLDRVTLKPGPHKVKAVGPKKKKKQFEITIYGGQDTNWGVITW